MLSPIEQFGKNISRVQVLDRVHTALDNTTTAALDLTDLLRAQIVMIVSALDLYIHEITRVGMLEAYNGKRPQTDAFLRFQVTLESTMQGIELAMQRISNASEDDVGEDEWLDSAIRERHSHRSFQKPDDIADAIRLFSSCKLWEDVAKELNLNAQDVKSRLLAIVKRRNQIVHEADLIPDYPGTITRWPISPTNVTSTLDFIQDVCEAIDVVSNRS